MPSKNFKKKILLIVSGGVAAYKALELIRLLAKEGIQVSTVLTASGAQFVTPLSISSLSGEKVYQDLFNLTDEQEMGHIRLAREADLILIAPATADRLAKTALGIADDLASTLLLASDRPLMIAPAMNPYMWKHEATQAHIKTLTERDAIFVGPEPGVMACGEEGLGRFSEPGTICMAVLDQLQESSSQSLSLSPLMGRRALVTSGPTHEPIDPVRYIANRSSGKQGYAIAEALRDAGAEVTLVSGPVNLQDPDGVKMQKVETARHMYEAVHEHLSQGPTWDISVFAAAVADWRPEDVAKEKRKKRKGETAPTFKTVENPDILASVSRLENKRPRLTIGFAAETQNLEANALAKKRRKGCDWLLANDVSPETETFGGDNNRILFIDENDQGQAWPQMTKASVGAKLVSEIEDFFAASESKYGR